MIRFDFVDFQKSEIKKMKEILGNKREKINLRKIVGHARNGKDKESETQ